jgi:hypothetical protein
MSFADECRHWTTPRWLSCIYERLLQPFAVTIDGTLPVSGDIAVSNFPNYKLPPYTRRTFVTTDGNITQINYFNGATQVAHRDLTYSAGAIATDTLSIP